MSPLRPQALVARLNTEGQHRGAVAAAKSLEEEERRAKVCVSYTVC